MLLEQGAALPLGHAAPHTELHPVVQGVGAALGDDGTVPADYGGLALGSTSNEELVRVGGPAQGLSYPGDPGLTLRAVE